MIKIVDKMLLFAFSLAIAAGSVIVILYTFGLSGDIFAWFAWERLSHSLADSAYVLLVSFALLLISLRFIYIVLRNGRPGETVDQRNDFGDVRISLETVESLTFKAAERIQGLKDVRARVRVGETGMELFLRADIDGERSIPEMTEEAQRTVKYHVEEVTGLPVASVHVFIANVNRAKLVQSRVE